MRGGGHELASGSQHSGARHPESPSVLHAPWHQVGTPGGGGNATPVGLSKVLARRLPSFLSASRPVSADGGREPLTVDFGEVLLAEAVTKQLLMSNHTAILAPFTIRAEFFNCDAAKPSNHSQRRCSPQ